MPRHAQVKRAQTRCPFCAEETSGVTNSRGRDGNVWRQRRCKACGRYYETLERVVGRLGGGWLRYAEELTARIRRLRAPDRQAIINYLDSIEQEYREDDEIFIGSDVPADIYVNGG